MGLLDPVKIHEIFNDCLFKEGESIEEYIYVKGLTMTFGLHPRRVQNHKEEIEEFINYVPKEFLEEEGGGYSFLYLPMDRNGDQCMEQHTAQELMVLLMAIGKMHYLVPRELWATLPGGVPYIVIPTNPMEVEIKSYKDTIKA